MTIIPESQNFRSSESHNIPEYPIISQNIQASEQPGPYQTTIRTKVGLNGVDDSTLHCKMQVGGLGDAHRVELVASQT